MAKCDSLVGRIERLIQAMDLLGVRIERASRGPSLATGPAKRMQAAATNEMHTDIAAAIDGNAPATRRLYAKALAAVPAWKAACKVEESHPRTPDYFHIYSPTKSHVWSVTLSQWVKVSQLLDYRTGAVSFYGTDYAREVLGTLTTPPPDWTEPAPASVNKNAILHTVGGESSQTATVSAPEDVIDPSHAAPGRVWYGGPTTEDVQEHLLCFIPPERSSYIRPTGKPGRFEHVWHDGSVTPSAFSDGGLTQCLKSPGWSMVYEPVARQAIGLPALSELDHCREA